MQSHRRTFPVVGMVLLLALLLLAACSPEAETRQALPLADIAEASDEAAAQPAAEPAAQEETSAAQQGDSNGTVAALEGTLSQIYEAVNPSVVHIRIMGDAASATSQIPGFSIPNQPLSGQGSGFVWDTEGHIVTNNHVVEGASEITVTFEDGTIVDATVVGTDPDSDLAVLKVERIPQGVYPVPVADSTTAKVGELVIAIGNPFGQNGTMTAGIISALGRLLPVGSGMSRYSIPDIIQTDAAINPGNSGGVLLNDQGELIGVTTAIISPAQVSAGIGYAVPSVIVQKVVPFLIEEGSFEHAYLGISGTALTPDLAEAMDLPTDQRGALVMEVVEGGPSAEAGLQGSTEEVEIDGMPVNVGGDVIVAIEGQEVQSIDDVISYLARYAAAGQEVSLTVLRDGDRIEIPVTLGVRPAPEERPEVAALPEGALPEGHPFGEQPLDPRDFFGQMQPGSAWLGISGMSVTPELSQALELPEEQTGVLVGEVVEDGPAAQAGLQGGDQEVTVNGQPVMAGGDIIIAADGETVEDMQALRAILAEHEPDDELSLTVLRDGETVELTVTLGEWPAISQ